MGNQYQWKQFCHFLSAKNTKNHPSFLKEVLSIGYLVLLTQHENKVKTVIKNNRFKQLNRHLATLKNNFPSENSILIDPAKAFSQIFLTILKCKQLEKECQKAQELYQKEENSDRIEQCRVMIADLMTQKMTLRKH